MLETVDWNIGELLSSEWSIHNIKAMHNKLIVYLGINKLFALSWNNELIAIDIMYRWSFA